MALWCYWNGYWTRYQLIYWFPFFRVLQGLRGSRKSIGWLRCAILTLSYTCKMTIQKHCSQKFIMEWHWGHSTEHPDSHTVILSIFPIATFYKSKSTKFSPSLHTTLGIEGEKKLGGKIRIDTFSCKYNPISPALGHCKLSSIPEDCPCCGSHKGSLWCMGWSHFSPGESESLLRVAWTCDSSDSCRFLSIKKIRLLQLFLVL